MMTLMELPPHYSGIAKLLPRRDLVLFPTAIESLTVTEPFEVQLIEKALAADRLLAVATGISVTGAGRSKSRLSMYRMVCLARVVEYETLSAGFTLSLLGIRRAWIRREVPTNQSFQLADLKILEPDPDDALLPIEVEQRSDLSPQQRDQLFQRLHALEHWNRELKRVLRSRMPDLLTTVLSMQQLLDSKKSLDSLTDLVTHLLRLPISLKLKQLQTTDPLVRAQRLLALFGRLHLRVGTDGFQMPGQPSVSDLPGVPVPIDYESDEFEILVRTLEHEAEAGKSPDLLAGEQPMLLDPSVQEFPENSETDKDSVGLDDPNCGDGESEQDPPEP